MRLNLSKFLLLNYKTLDSKLCLSKELVKRNYGVLSLIYSLHHFENFTKNFFTCLQWSVPGVSASLE